MTYRNWHIEPHPDWGFTYSHDEYCGAPDSGDRRCGTAETIDEAKLYIDEYEYEQQENLQAQKEKR